MRQLPGERIRGSLQRKLLRTLLVVVVLVGLGTLSVVSYWSARTSSSNLDDISQRIEAQLDAKGRGLVENHTLPLKGLIQDNAFSDIEMLIGRTVDHDSDVLYGVLTDAEGKKLAFAARGVAKAGGKEKAPWQALGLPEMLPKTARVEVRRVHASGEEVLEVAAPVIIDNEVAATLRYGISTRKMQEALTAARARARADLVLTLVSLSCLVLVVGAAGVFLGRREATRIVEPLQALTAAARSLAGGDREVRVHIRSGDELEMLGNTFDQMAADLATSYKSLEDLNQHLEQKVEARTAELGARNRDMRLVLDNVVQGLITIDARGVMAQERSAILERWFGHAKEGMSLPEYLEPSAKPFADQLRIGLMQLEDGFLPREVCLAQLPENLMGGGRHYRVRYEPIGDDDPVTGVLVMIDDITEALALQREERAQREVLHAVQRLTRDRSGFLSFARDAERLLGQIRTCTDMPVLKRAIHTLKGNASLFGLHVIAGLCHDMEEHMADDESGGPSDRDIEALSARWQELMESLDPFFGKLQAETVEISRADLTSLLSCLRTPGRARDAERLVNTWSLEPIGKPLERLAEQAKLLAVRLERGDVTCTVEHDGTRLDSESWAPFWSAMAHVVRNAIDHGLETPDERAAKQKGGPRLTFRASTVGPEVVISVSDDGRGIAWEALRSRLRARDLPSTTRDDLVNGMLTDGITTRDQQTDVSGRGVGMAAVKNTVQRMGGKLSVESTPDAGTSWTFVIPAQPHRHDSLPSLQRASFEQRA